MKCLTVNTLNEQSPTTSEAPSEQDKEEPEQIKPKFCVWHKSYISACKTCQEANEKVEIDREDDLTHEASVAEKAKHRYFVSNYFVEKIFDNIMDEIKIFSSKLEDEMQITQEKTNSLLNIREEELP